MIQKNYENHQKLFALKILIYLKIYIIRNQRLPFKKLNIPHDFVSIISNSHITLVYTLDFDTLRFSSIDFK